MSRKICAVFGSGVFSKTMNVFQWDSDDRLVFSGINLPETYEVHFANSLTGEAKKAFGTSDGIEITEAEYSELLGIIHSALKAPHGYQYRLRTDTLEWELVEMPPVEPEDEEATAEDYEAALKEMGVNV